jgi:hypothetical protein
MSLDLLTKLAAKHKVATQMGNQGASGAGVAETCELLWSGAIGDITRVECLHRQTNLATGFEYTPERGDWVPDTLDWESISQDPQKWFLSITSTTRGTGEAGGTTVPALLGDMACHILHPVFEGLKLGYPTKAQGSSSLVC